MRTHESRTRQNRSKKRIAPNEPAPTAQMDYEKEPGHQAASPVSFRDDLVLIDGIDPTLEMALNSIGIQRFADFRDYTPETLAQALQDRTGVPVSAETIAKQDWIGWAQILLDEPASQIARLDEERIADENLSNTSVQPVEQSLAHSEKVVIDDAAPESDQMQSADSVATPPRKEAATEKEAKSKRQQLQADDAERSERLPNQKSGGKSAQSASVESLRWAKSNLPKAKPIAQAVGEKSKLEEHHNKEIILSITHATFKQQDMPVIGNRRLKKILHGEIGYVLEMANTPATFPGPLTVCAQIHAVDLSNGVSELLASKSHPVLASRHDYRADLDFDVPRFGRYQLQVVAFLLGAQPKLALYKGPLLRVEEW